MENIVIAGHDNVLLELIDGSLIEGPSVADSDEELIDFLVFLASRSEVNARSFSEAQPRLHLRLDGGSRLARRSVGHTETIGGDCVATG